MRARGVHTFDAYSQVLDADATEYDRLLDTLTINVTKFWRNAETWQALAPYVLELWNARHGHMRVWSAGCASGESPTPWRWRSRKPRAACAKTICCHASASTRPTWIGKASSATRAGDFPPGTFSEMPADLTRRYFTAGATRRAAAGPGADRAGAPPRSDARAAPNPPYDLIVCRNVVIYFDRPMQERLFQTFADASGAGGSCCSARSRRWSGPRASASSWKIRASGSTAGPHDPPAVRKPSSAWRTGPPSAATKRS